MVWKLLEYGQISFEEENKMRVYLLSFFSKLYHNLGWVNQLHINCIRDNNTRMYKKVGSDTGFDAINDGEIAISLSRLLNAMNEENSLPIA